MSFFTQVVKFAAIRCDKNCPSATVQANKELVATAINEVFNRKNSDAIATYWGDTYYQHDPSGADGQESVHKDLATYSDMQWDIKRIIAENDLVLAHCRLTTGGMDLSRVDIWRVRDGKLVEHWGLMQPVPDEMAHRNGMF